MNQKIWIFVLEKPLSVTELDKLKAECLDFVANWKSHDHPVKAEFELYKNRLLIFKNDEDFNPIGGCATDKLFHFIQSLEKKYQTSLLNRRLFVFENDNYELEVYPLEELHNLLNQGIIKESTKIFNTAIIHSSEMDNFVKPLSESWIAALV